jgi:tryptophan-rich sensory protein
VGGTLLAGFIGGLLGGSTGQYATLKSPPLAPPGWLFAPVWLLLYTAMGVAAYLVWQTGDEDRGQALRLYGWQLAVNVLWTLFYFRLEWRLFSFFWILLLIALVALTIQAFYAHSRLAALLLIPYLLWLLFAAYLNLGYYVLNG